MITIPGTPPCKVIFVPDNTLQYLQDNQIDITKLNEEGGYDKYLPRNYVMWIITLNDTNALSHINNKIVNNPYFNHILRLLGHRDLTINSKQMNDAVISQAGMLLASRYISFFTDSDPVTFEDTTNNILYVEVNTYSNPEMQSSANDLLPIYRKLLSFYTRFIPFKVLLNETSFYRRYLETVSDSFV